MNVTKFLIIILTAFIFACEYVEEPTVEEINHLINSWQVSQVFIDGQEDIVTNYDNFNLIINKDNTFSFTDINGNNESGQWELQNNNTRLLLNPGLDEEVVYRIISAEPVELILLTEKTNFKDIPAAFRYVLVPKT